MRFSFKIGNISRITKRFSGKICYGNTKMNKWNNNWPVVREYDSQHLARIALPLGGIGTGTVSLGGRGDLRDWEIMNKPAKGFIPSFPISPFFALFVRTQDGDKIARALEGPLDISEYEGASGSKTPGAGLPRFRKCSFACAYPTGQVHLSDAQVPLKVRIEAFNPMVPSDITNSSFPAAVLRYVLINPTNKPLKAAVCGVLPNFIGRDATQLAPDRGEKDNVTTFKKSSGIQGLHFTSKGVDKYDPAWGEMVLTTSEKKVTYLTGWPKLHWTLNPLLMFWDDFSDDGMLDKNPDDVDTLATGSLAAACTVPANGQYEIAFYLTWWFPNRYTWTPSAAAENESHDSFARKNIVGNHYTTQFAGAWDVAERFVPKVKELEKQTLKFLDAFCSSDLPDVVKEASLFNLSTLRTQTVFRTSDGRSYGWEGCNDNDGSCHGSCTHVWNYELATPFLFGDIAMSMREVEFMHATDTRGMMSFRVHLPLERATEFGHAAADGQLGCIMKMYREWSMSGDDAFLAKCWPKVKLAMEFCWIENGWDSDCDGVMEGCQHNTMDVEYFGPNPQMQAWYLGALKSVEQMAIAMKDNNFAEKCRALFLHGSRWMDENLFTGEYYRQIVQPRAKDKIAQGLLYFVSTPENPQSQIGDGCLIDQLVGQYMSHICSLGYLVKKSNVRKMLGSILKYNSCRDFYSHFNCRRSYVLGDEKALLMTGYPASRPEQPFPYFTEVMTGFEYVVAVELIQEGMAEKALQVISNIRNRYDGAKRNPFDEAECGHHYARAMSSWGAVPAWSGFEYSGACGRIAFNPTPGRYFWSNGSSWGTVEIKNMGRSYTAELSVLYGRLKLKEFRLNGIGTCRVENKVRPRKGNRYTFRINGG